MTLRASFAGHVAGVRIAELVRRELTPDSCARRCDAYLKRPPRRHALPPALAVFGQHVEVMDITDSAHLARARAVWSPGPQVGGWIAERLGPFGPSVGHAVPHGYAAYAVIPLWQAEESDGERSTRLAPLLEVLEPFTGSQPVHCGMWDGFGWIHEPDRDPRNAAKNVGVWWPSGTERPSQADIAQARLEAAEWLSQRGTAAPGLPLLELPHRSYHLWTGPLAAALTFEHQPDPPSLIWPGDRSWFLGAPIYTEELALGATQDIVDAVLKDSRLNARSAALGEYLDIDD